jgi:hypothetical protein
MAKSFESLANYGSATFYVLMEVVRSVGTALRAAIAQAPIFRIETLSHGRCLESLPLSVCYEPKRRQTGQIQGIAIRGLSSFFTGTTQWNCRSGDFVSGV